MPYKGQNGVFLKLPHGWELAPSDADSLGVCGVIFKCTHILFSTWLCPRQSFCSSFLFITHELKKTGSHGWNTRRMVLGNGSGVYTSVFGATRFKHTFRIFDTLTCFVLQGSLLELLATTSTTLSSDPWAHHPTSNTLYALCTPQHENSPSKIHNLSYISHAPGQQRHDCCHLDSQTRSAQQACATRQCSARARQRRGQEEEVACRHNVHAHNCIIAFIYLLSLAVKFIPRG